jgi:hypothetical protein
VVAVAAAPCNVEERKKELAHQRREEASKTTEEVKVMKLNATYSSDTLHNQFIYNMQY